MSIDASGAFGKGGGLGLMTLGFNYLGYYTKYAGIYVHYKNPGFRYLLRKKHYRPTNPHTIPQENWRDVFRAGRALWATLTPEDHLYWHKRGQNERMSGLNLFMRYYLNNHKL